MQADFARSLQLVLIDEGGLDDDPHDHGGRTAHGIIQREYDGFRARHGLPRQDVWKITPAEYTEIYHDRYWDPWCDQLPAGVDYVFFDVAVNAGPGQAVRQLQRVLGVRVDGHMGEVMLKQLRETEDLQGLIKKYCNVRRAFYRALAQFPRYGRGWLARVDHCEHAALRIAATGVAPARRPLSPQLQEQATARAQAEKPATPPVAPSTGTVTTVGAGAGSWIMEQLHPYVEQLQSLQGAVRGIEVVLAGIAFVGVGLTLYGFWKEAQTKKAIA